ncbi:predicted protein [Sclerotinia sclerotiorum 1980 UF-70]|uniref:Uncharacterized protein n=1 Tax=Sclerotinia sclerotiorum (strain ATCC 18683 / 1980 / Ss-1) TaxID=665079 RepID=A7ED97_SCLS1|nr:predicted protein [Sclerotinia sclerotiorum 1980 UF-70]EDO00813.1 predicted protein [Sclerotinia sclerotiorum 1980 UF-70]
MIHPASQGSWIWRKTERINNRQVFIDDSVLHCLLEVNPLGWTFGNGADALKWNSPAVSHGCSAYLHDGIFNKKRIDHEEP